MRRTVLLLTSIQLGASLAFSPASLILSSTGTKSCQVRRWSVCLGNSNNSSNDKEKRRRRRKDSSATPSISNLPEFDYDEIGDEPIRSPTPSELPFKPSNKNFQSSTASSAPLKRGSGLNPQLAEELGGNVIGLDEDLILSTMRGKNNQWDPPTSLQETLRDRSLERYMNFDAMIQNEAGSSTERVVLPTMEEIVARRKSREAVGQEELEMDYGGKKATKRAKRVAAAIQREKLVEEEKTEMLGLGDLNLLQLLERGAWVGIGLLVLWEIYINSPFFERAAPLTPIVFDKTPGM